MGVVVAVGSRDIGRIVVFCSDTSSSSHIITIVSVGSRDIVVVDGDFIVDDDQPEFLIVTSPPSFKLSDEVKEVVEEKSFNWKE